MVSPIYGSSSTYQNNSIYSGGSQYAMGGQSAQSLAGQFNSSVSSGHTAKPPKKEGGFFGAIKGIAKGFVTAPIKMIQGLKDPKNLAMLVGGIALTVATGGAAAPFLIGAGIAMSGAKMASAAAKGDWEGVGEGAFGVAASVAGAKAAGGTKITATNSSGTTFTANTAATGGSRIANAWGTAKNYTNVLRGKTQLTSATGETATLGSIARGNATNFAKTNPIATSIQGKVTDLHATALEKAPGLTTRAEALGAQGKTLAAKGVETVKGKFGKTAAATDDAAGATTPKAAGVADDAAVAEGSATPKAAAAADDAAATGKPTAAEVKEMATKKAEGLRTKASEMKKTTETQMRSDLDALKARQAAGDTLNPLEQQYMNYYSRVLGESGASSFTQRAASPFKLLYGGARQYPQGSLPTVGIISQRKQDEMAG